MFFFLLNDFPFPQVKKKKKKSKAWLISILTYDCILFDQFPIIEHLDYFPLLLFHFLR